MNQYPTLLRRLGLTPRGVTVLLGVGASGGVLVAVLVHLGWIARSGVLWVAAGALVGYADARVSRWSTRSRQPAAGER